MTTNKRRTHSNKILKKKQKSRRRQRRQRRQNSSLYSYQYESANTGSEVTSNNKYNNLNNNVNVVHGLKDFLQAKK